MAGGNSGLAARSKEGADARGTREKILDCAARLYSRHGYGEGSIRNIAAEIGIRGPSLYHHFASKEEVTMELFRVAAQTACAEFEQLKTLGAGVTPEVLLDAAIAAHLRTLFHPKRYLAALHRIYGEVPGELREAATRELSPYLKAWMGVLQRVHGKPAQDSAITEVHAFFIFGALDSIVEWHYGARAERFSLDNLRVLLRDMLLHGIGRPKE
jgi:TetR/AcrR family transcriptional regulator, cholesterol catabolism regulator